VLKRAIAYLLKPPFSRGVGGISTYITQRRSPLALLKKGGNKMLVEVGVKGAIAFLGWRGRSLYFHLTYYSNQLFFLIISSNKI
jgi:hypothetical protein